jgi:hypothetical protein
MVLKWYKTTGFDSKVTLLSAINQSDTTSMVPRISNPQLPTQLKGGVGVEKNFFFQMILKWYKTTGFDSKVTLLSAINPSDTTSTIPRTKSLTESSVRPERDLISDMRNQVPFRSTLCAGPWKLYLMGLWHSEGSLYCQIRLFYLIWVSFEKKNFFQPPHPLWVG